MTLMFHGNSWRLTDPMKTNYAQVGTVITSLSQVPLRATSHKDLNTGKSIMKQQLMEPFRAPYFVGFSIATFEPSQSMMPPHAHETMHEFFFVLEGRAVILIDGIEHDMEPFTFVHLAPGEKHGIFLPDGEEYNKPMKMAVFGVVTDQNDRY